MASAVRARRNDVMDEENCDVRIAGKKQMATQCTWHYAASEEAGLVTWTSLAARNTLPWYAHSIRPCTDRESWFTGTPYKRLQKVRCCRPSDTSILLSVLELWDTFVDPWLAGQHHHGQDGPRKAAQAVFAPPLSAGPVVRGFRTEPGKVCSQRLKIRNQDMFESCSWLFNCRETRCDYLKLTVAHRQGAENSTV